MPKNRMLERTTKRNRNHSTTLIAVLFWLMTLSTLPILAEETGDDGRLTDAERGRLVQLLEDAQSETDRLIAKTSDADWNRRPAPEAWSVADVVEHLAMAERSLQSLCRRALDAPVHPEWQSIAAAGIDGVLTQLADRSQRLSAPEALEPTGAYERDDVIERYRAARGETLIMVRTLQDPVKKHTATGPAGDLNVEQWLALVAAHNLRHNRQIEETLGSF